MDTLTLQLEVPLDDRHASMAKDLEKHVDEDAGTFVSKHLVDDAFEQRIRQLLYQLLVIVETQNND